MNDLREHVLEANPLDVILQQYGVQVPPGRGRVALRCPLPGHEDQDPSFTADLDKGLWHCFGCGRGGTVFDLVMHTEGVDFGEAFRKLAERAGLKNRRFLLAILLALGFGIISQFYMLLSISYKVGATNRMSWVPMTYG